MRTYLLAQIERETGVDYWVDATTGRGPRFMLDDITGLCKFALLEPSVEAEAIRIATGLEITTDELLGVVDRTFVRGYANERRRGFVDDDYSLPSQAHKPIEHSSVPQSIQKSSSMSSEAASWRPSTSVQPPPACSEPSSHSMKPSAARSLLTSGSSSS
jgi:hypothetical protein